MHAIARQVQLARRRLWVNRFLARLGWTMSAAAGAWMLALVVVRVFGLDWPLGLIAGVCAAAGLAIASVSTLMRRETALDAAMVLDQVAGLKERVSSGLACAGRHEPFAVAVVADAERVVSRLSVRQFVPIRPSRSLAWGAASVIVALGFLWLFPQFDLLRKAEARERRQRERLVASEVRSRLARPVDAVKSLVESNPELKNLESLRELEQLAQPSDKPVDPSDLRREAIKKLDRVGEDLRKQAASDRFRQMQDLKNRLREMNRTSDRRTPASKLLQALSDGDFKGAEEEVRRLKDELAKAKRDPKNAEQARKIEQQLDDLAKRLNEASRDQNLEQAMKNAGLSEEQMKRVLDALAKKDPQQLQQMMQELEKKLKDQGMSQPQIDKLKEQVRQSSKSRAAGEACEKLSKCMKAASGKSQQGDPQSAARELDEAAETLSEMEMLDQQLGEMESKLSELDDMKRDLGDETQDSSRGACKDCGGSGMRKDGSPCGTCESSGSGAGGRGRGAGQRARDTDGDVDFERKRAKVRQREGVVIGQYFEKGEQLKGEAKAPYLEAVRAAVRDASDAIEREQVPRAYQRAVKNYFNRLGERAEKMAEQTTTAPSKP